MSDPQRKLFKGHNGDPTTGRCKDCDMPVAEWAGKGPCSGTKPIPPDRYAVVEVFGHQRHVGRISEVEQFGTKMMRMDEPIAGQTVSFDDGRFTTYFLAGASIFRMTPCTLEFVQHHHFRPERQVGRLTAPLVLDRAAFLGEEDVTEEIYDESDAQDGDVASSLNGPDKNVSREAEAAALMKLATGDGESHG